MTLIAQISDLHIREPGQLAYGRINTAPFLEKTVAALNALRQMPDAVVITGDLTDFGRATEYDHLRRLLTPLRLPVYLMPGNHDDRQGLRAAFPDHAYLGEGDFIQYTADIGAVRLVALDTCIPGESGGALCARRLDWLAKVLQESRDRPVIVAMHHPPFRTLIGHMDDIGLLEGAEALERIVQGHDNVERIICGHLHRAIDTRFGGTIACTTPAPAHQVTLDLHPQAESTWTLEPPAFRLFAWDAPSHRLVTHLASAGHFDGPHPFHENGQLID